VSWEARLLDLFEDLEQQAEGAALAARDSEVAELARAEYSEVDLASRCHASLGQQVELTGPAGLVVRGRLARAGDGWCLVVADTQEWLFALTHLHAVRGLSAQARPPALRPLTARLGLGSVLRELAEDQAEVTVVRPDGELRRGRIGRVGRDFLELTSDGVLGVVPFSAVLAVRR
jgi:hypothetical protein